MISEGEKRHAEWGGESSTEKKGKTWEAIVVGIVTNLAPRGLTGKKFSPKEGEWLDNGRS